MYIQPEQKNTKKKGGINNIRFLRHTSPKNRHGQRVVDCCRLIRDERSRIRWARRLGLGLDSALSSLSIGPDCVGLLTLLLYSVLLILCKWIWNQNGFMFLWLDIGNKSGWTCLKPQQPKSIFYIEYDFLFLTGSRTREEKGLISMSMKESRIGSSDETSLYWCRTLISQVVKHDESAYQLQRASRNKSDETEVPTNMKFARIEAEPMMIQRHRGDELAGSRLIIFIPIRSCRSFVKNW